MILLILFVLDSSVVVEPPQSLRLQLLFLLLLNFLIEFLYFVFNQDLLLFIRLELHLLHRLIIANFVLQFFVFPVNVLHFCAHPLVLYD